VLLLAGYAIYAASGWPAKAALFPLAIGIPMFCLAAIELLWAWFGAPERDAAAAEIEPTMQPGAGRRIAIAALWMIGFFAAIVLLGFPVAVAAFLFLYLKFQGGEGWTLSIVITALTWAAFYGLFDALLHLPFPQGWLIATFAS
jgi:hypothetical protein